METTEVTLQTGERLLVQGSVDAVEKTVVAASRGSIMQLAWLIESTGGERVGINPTAVVSLRNGGT